MYKTIPSNHKGRIQSFFLACFGKALVRTWSSFVRLSPAAFRMEARRMMERPMMKATTGWSEWPDFGDGMEQKGEQHSHCDVSAPDIFLAFAGKRERQSGS